MSVSYKPLWIELIKKDLKRTDLIEKAGVTKNTIAKMGKDEYISLRNLEKLCRGLNLQPNQVIEFTTDNEL